jgi:L-lactate dehydrogenase (cytochrome)
MTPINIEDLRQLAKRRLPKMVFDNIDGAAHDELTMRANRADFERIRFRQRVLVDVSKLEIETELFGEKFAMPLVLTPLGMQGVIAREGELQAARAAERCGIRLCLSTVSTCSVEQVQATVPAARPIWFQLYMSQDKGFMKALLERAQAVGCRVLVFTVDGASRGQRERDLHNGFTVPPRITPSFLLDVLTHPRWAADVLLGPRLSMRNVDPSGRQSVMKAGKVMGGLVNPANDWRDLDWVRGIWKGPIVVKGVLDPEDARLALAHGAEGISVSNHGGRKLDGAPSAISALPAIVDAVGDRATVLMDGGVRRGHDIVKALALGAKACLIGRAFAYGLGASGQTGVEQAIRILEGELCEAMMLLGCPSVKQLDRSWLLPEI